MGGPEQLRIDTGEAVWDRADDRLALGFWPWSLLAQPEPLPERLIGAAPDAVIANAPRAWQMPPGRVCVHRPSACGRRLAHE